ncbi:MAG: hypothetical protein ACFFG0_36665 [Candidatus Thorarchaeota archaeon]
MTDELSAIFDDGNETHEEDEELTEGARNIIRKEDYMRIVYIPDGEPIWGIAGLLDYDKFCWKFSYIEDLKSTSFNGLYFFLKEYDQKEGVKFDYKIQISIYRFMKYVIYGVKRKLGVITRIDKDCITNRISLTTPLFKINYVNDFLVNHPVILFKIGKITEKELIKRTIEKLRPEVNPKTGEYWKCGNCQYADGTCPVRQGL